MTVLVSVKINDGVVMAADSASSFESGMVYQNADKIVNLMEGLPIGAMATGAGGIGNESIDTLMKDLRRRFSGADAKHPDWALDPVTYTLRDVAIRLRSFLFEEKVKAYSGSVWTRVRICGYSAGRPLAEVWEVLLLGLDSPSPTQVQGEQEFGIRWDGEYEALSRLIFGLGTKFEECMSPKSCTVAARSSLNNLPNCSTLISCGSTPSFAKVSFTGGACRASSVRVFALNPVWRAAGRVARILPFRHDASGPG